VIVGVGIDVVDVDRFGSTIRRTPSMLERLFTEEERDAPPFTLAGRFAVKEALAKTLGAPSGLRWHDAVVSHGEGGRPVLTVTGTVAEQAARLGADTFHVSVSHDGGIATAIVVAESRGQAAG